MRKIPFIFILLFSCKPLHAQFSFDRYLQASFLPRIHLDEYADLNVEWNLPGKIQMHLNDGITELKEKNFLRAANSFDSVIHHSPSLGLAYYYRGICKQNLRQFKEAQSDLMQAARLLPKTPEIRLELGEVYQVQLQFDKAKDEFKNATEIDPAFVEGYFAQGNVARFYDEESKAIRQYMKCIELNPKFAKAHLQLGLLKYSKKKKDEAHAYFDKAIEADSAYQEGLLIRGLVYLVIDSVKKCLQDWDALVRYNPENVHLRLLRSRLYIDLKEYDKAFADMTKAFKENYIDEDEFSAGQTDKDKQIDLQTATSHVVRVAYGLPDDAFKHLQAGFCLLLAGKHDDAIGELNLSTKKQPSGCALYLKAITFEHTNRHDSAFVNYDKALRYDNDIFDAHKKRGLYRSELKNWKGAMQDYNEMIRLQPELLVSYRLRGYAQGNAKAYAGCIMDLTKVLKHDTTDHDAYVNRGHCQKLIGALKAANQDYEKALSLNSVSSQLYEEIVINYLEMQDTAAALLNLIRYETRQPYSIFIPFTRARIYIMQHKWTLAESTLNHLRSKSNITGNPEPNSRLIFLEGLLRYEQKDLKKSLSSFERAIRKDGHNLEARYYKAKALISLNEQKLAIEELRELKKENYLDSAKLLDGLLSQN